LASEYAVAFVCKTWSLGTLEMNFGLIYRYIGLFHILNLNSPFPYANLTPKEENSQEKAPASKEAGAFAINLLARLGQPTLDDQ
jgi:hypothetical protein